MSERFEYDYDLNGNRSAERRYREGTLLRALTFGYDLLDRMQTVTDGTRSISYSYDDVGNRLTETGTRLDGTAVSYTYRYDGANRLQDIQDGTGTILASYGHDANGNITSITRGNESWSYDYDVREQMVRASRTVTQTQPETEAGYYSYDFGKRRIGRNWDSDGWTWSVYGQDSVVSEYNSTGNQQNRYEYANGMVVRGEQDGYYFSDAQGSVTFVAGTEPQVTRTEYDPWGVILSGTRDGSTISYTGQWRDDQTGLMPLGNGERYYDPLLGRFIQEDSFAGMYTLPQSLNRYAYVHNNPTRFTDPSGHFAPLVALGVIAGAALGGFLFGAGLSIARQAVASVTTDHQFSAWEVVESGLHGAAWGAGLGALAVALPLVGVSAATVTVGASIGFGLVSLVSAAIEAERGNKALAAFDAATIFLPAFSSKARGDFGEFYGGGYTGSGLPKVIVEGYRSLQPGVAEVTQHLYSSQDRLTHLEAALRQNQPNRGQGGGFDGMSPGAELVTPEGITLPVPEKSAAQALNSFAVQGGNRWAGKVLGKIVYKNETFTIESDSFEVPRVEEWASTDGLGALERHLLIKEWEALIGSESKGVNFWEKLRLSPEDKRSHLRGIGAEALVLQEIRKINRTLKDYDSPYRVTIEPSANFKGERLSTIRELGSNRVIEEGISVPQPRIPFKGILNPDIVILDTRIIDTNSFGDRFYRAVSVMDISFGSLNPGSTTLNRGHKHHLRMVV